MKEYPFVSVCVVALNAGRYIEECLQSIYSLNYPKDKYEILLIDGGSIDNTLKIAKKFKRVEILNNQKKIISAGRNMAIENSRGKYLVFTDSDCKVDSEWLINLTKRIINSQDNVVAYGGPNLVFEEDPPIGKVIGYMQETLFGSGGSPGASKIKEGKEVISLGNANIIYKIDIIKNYRYNERLNVGEDCDFNFRLKEKGYRFIYTNEAVIWHHRRTSISGFVKNMFKYGEAQSKMLIIYKRLIRNYAVLPSLFVIYLIIGFVLSLMTLQNVLKFYLLTIALYLFMLTPSLIYTIRKTGLFGILSIIFLPIQHIAYGVGFLWGLIK